MWLFTQERDCVFRHGILSFSLHQQERYNLGQIRDCELLYKYAIDNLDSNVLRKEILDLKLMLDLIE